MGFDTLSPFLDYADKGSIILCLTSNAGYSDFEKQDISGEPLYIKVARKAVENNKNGNIGLVVGATHPEEAVKVREAAPELPFLMPGIGAQGGDPAKIVSIGKTKLGLPPIVNSSRGIIYAGENSDFAQAAKTAALKTRDILNEYLK
jgi:orotidine-5'-phosphate decarboxylase